MILIPLLLFLVGTFIGSFLYVVILRIPRNQSFITGRSRCDTCGRILTPLDLVPLFSFLFLRGKCRYCSAVLSYKYPLIEGLTGIAFVTTYLFIPSFSLLHILFALFITAVLIGIFFIDLFEGIIPFILVFPGIAVAGLFLLFSGGSALLITHLISGFIAAGFFLALFLGTRGRGMGFGDVVYAFFMGMVLGFPGIAVGLYVAFLTGGIISLILILLKRKKFRGSTIPFGPFLVLGTYVAYLWGEGLVDYILKMLL